MAAGFYISRVLAITGALLSVGALASIIALSVLYAQEKTKNLDPSPTSPATTTTAATGSSSSPSPSPGPQEPWQRYRLPDTLAPVHYDITLWPRLEPDGRGLFIFTGNSTVKFACVKDTDLILIHSSKLNFTLFQGHEARLMALDAAQPAPRVQSSWLEEETEYLVLQLDGALRAGRTYLLETQFQGELGDDLQGFYRSQYTEDGVQK